jgi:hypothetical protein
MVKRRNKKECTKSTEETPDDTAQYMKDRRTKTGTKRNYQSKINVIVKWLQHHAPEALDNNNMIHIPSSSFIQNDDEKLQHQEHLNILRHNIKRFFGAMSLNAAVLLRANDEDVASLPTPLSISTLRGYRSALVDLYRVRGIKFDPLIDFESNEILDGYEKVICELKQKGRMAINEGKRHLKWDGYSLLAEKFIAMSPPENGRGQSWSTSVFGWCFHVLMWNLMSRSESVDALMLQHVDWDGDALTIEEQGHKGDQTGENKYPKHIYANPNQPSKCPILALAVQFFSFPQRLQGQQQLLAGTNSKDRFGNLLRGVLLKLDENESQRLGGPIEDFGTHSLRKGSSTYALGQVSGPTPVSVFLRMGQTLGQLKDRYIHFAEGADQLCGRMVAGLPFDSKDFAILPPHFPNEVKAQMDINFWREVLCGYDNYPKGMKAALPYLLASLIHHEKFLRITFREDHPIFKSRVFSHTLIDTLRGSPLLRIGRCPDTDMVSTGIPPHLALAEQVFRLEEKQKYMDQKLDTLQEHMENEFARNVASKVVQEIQDNFTIDGMAPVSMRSIANHLQDMENRIVNQFKSGIGSKEQECVSSKSSAKKTVTWGTWYWGDGRYHFVPQDWLFPVRLTVKSVWDLWWHGDVSSLIRPYHSIDFSLELKESHIRMRACRAGRCIDYLVDLVKTHEFLPEGHSSLSKLSLEQTDEVFIKVFPIAIEKLYAIKKKQPGRPLELTYGTMYDIIPKPKKRQKKNCPQARRTRSRGH